MISAWLLLLQSLCITMSSNVSPLSMIGGVVATKMINARKQYDVALQYPLLYFRFSFQSQRAYFDSQSYH